MHSNELKTAAGAPLSAKNLNTIKKTEKFLRQNIKLASCEKIVTSHKCESLYAQIERNGSRISHYKRNCAQEAKDAGSRKWLELLQTILFGTENAERKKLRREDRGFFEGVGESIISAPESWWVNHKKEVACNRNLNEKKQFFYLYNANRPKNLQVKMPSLAWFNSETCSEVIDYINMTGTRLKVNEEYKQGVKFKSVGEEIPSDVATIARGEYRHAREKLKKLGIKYECYNSKKRAELIGEVAGTITMVALPMGVSVKLLRIAGLTKFADAIDVVGVSDASVEDAAATNASREALTNVDDSARIKRAEKLLGRKLTKKQERALIEAHEVGKPELVDGELRYTPKEIREKAKVLAKAGFKLGNKNGGKDEIRILMENRIVGKFDPDSYITSGSRAPGARVWVIDPDTGRLIDGTVVTRKPSGMYEVKIGEQRSLFKTTVITQHYLPETVFTPVEPGDTIAVKRTGGYIANARVIRVDRDRNLVTVSWDAGGGISGSKTVSLDELQVPYRTEDRVWFKGRDGEYHKGVIEHLSHERPDVSISYTHAGYIVHEDVPYRNISRESPTEDMVNRARAEAAQFRARAQADARARAEAARNRYGHLPIDLQHDVVNYGAEYKTSWEQSPDYVRFKEKFKAQFPNIQKLYEIKDYVRAHGANPAMEQEAKQIWRRLQSDFHTDKYSSAPPEVQNYIKSRVQEINKQYKEIKGAQESVAPAP